jgi:uncharacterized protein (DUF58 family)
MMTSQAKWLALAALGMLVIGFINTSLPLTLVATTVLLWMLISYVVFIAQTTIAARSMQITRRIQHRESESGILWAGRTYDVDLQIETRGKLKRGWMLRDLVPELLEVRSQRGRGTSTEIQPLPTSIERILSKLVRWISPSESNLKTIDYPHHTKLATDLRLANVLYAIRPLGSGLALIPGVRLEAKDSMGWYRLDRVIPCRQQLQVLPKFHGLGELCTIQKKSNVIPQHGMHRERRPGIGFELLELREYTDGDPPKTIAWKASARRETLMTRQYESEIPIRIHFFVEGTVAIRIGGFGQRLIDQINSVLCSVTKIATRGGDWVGAYLLDGSHVRRIAPATGEKGFYQMAKAVAAFAASELPNRTRWTESMQETTYAMISEHYPSLLHQDLHPLSQSLWNSLRSKERRQRTQISAILADRYELSLIDQVDLHKNDDALASWMQRFLWEHGQSWMAPMIPYTEIAKMQNQYATGELVRCIRQAISRAKDNEVFVVFADLLGSKRDATELIQILRFAKAQHHRVIVISNSPDFMRPGPVDFTPPSGKEIDWNEIADKIRIHESASDVIAQFREAGISFAISTNESMIPTLLAEIEFARSGRAAKSNFH